MKEEKYTTIEQKEIKILREKIHDLKMYSYTFYLEDSRLFTDHGLYFKEREFYEHQNNVFIKIYKNSTSKFQIIQIDLKNRTSRLYGAEYSNREYMLFNNNTIYLLDKNNKNLINILTNESETFIQETTNLKSINCISETIYLLVYQDDFFDHIVITDSKFTTIFNYSCDIGVTLNAGFIKYIDETKIKIKADSIKSKAFGITVKNLNDTPEVSVKYNIYEEFEQDIVQIEYKMNRDLRYVIVKRKNVNYNGVIFRTYGSYGVTKWNQDYAMLQKTILENFVYVYLVQNEENIFESKLHSLKSFNDYVEDINNILIKDNLIDLPKIFWGESAGGWFALFAGAEFKDSISIVRSTPININEIESGNNYFNNYYFNNSFEMKEILKKNNKIIYSGSQGDKVVIFNDQINLFNQLGLKNTEFIELVVSNHGRGNDEIEKQYEIQQITNRILNKFDF